MTESAASAHDSGAAPASRVLGDRELLVVSNREPYTRDFDEAEDITVGRPAGGLTAALDPVLQSLGGTWVTWITWGSGDADRAVSTSETERRRCMVWLRRIVNDNSYYRWVQNQFRTLAELDL